MNLVEFMTQHDILTMVIITTVNTASIVVVFLMATRRGWWKPTQPVIDWTSTDRCSRCWEHGPYPGWQIGTLSDPEQARERHQEWHELTSVLLAPVARWIERKMRRSC